ncbi:hypothetical protein LJC63_00110 [Ruminococcaceae bacterium OttesenSCG-928-L11]|nr:hypothetical protein [Ruminococcaceae bacterium OttesenSCG-928-L11]MDL2274142.1 hypothetical protein [Oscillospiraceae bacterium OttesenSCG-928-G22]
MNGNTATDFRNPAYVRKAGMTALQKELGAVGAVYFLRQFENGKGNYTEERDRLLDGITFDELMKNVRELDKLNG